MALRNFQTEMPTKEMWEVVTDVIDGKLDNEPKAFQTVDDCLSFAYYHFRASGGQPTGMMEVAPYNVETANSAIRAMAKGMVMGPGIWLTLALRLAQLLAEILSKKEEAK